MPINPAIEEKAKAFTNNTPTTETDAEFLQRSYEFAQDIYQLGVSDGEERTKNEQSRDPLPCPHGREPMGGQDGWKHCPHCLGLNSN